MSGPIRTIAVVGHGITGWVAAAVLATRLPGVRVALVRATPHVAPMIDGCAVLSPDTLDMYRGIVPDWGAAIVALAGAIRLGTEIDAPRGCFVHAYGEIGTGDGLPEAPTAWSTSGVGSFHDLVPAAVLGLNDRAPSANALFHDVEFGLCCNAELFATFIEQRARLAGVQVSSARFGGARGTPERIDVIDLDDGTSLIADLYVDGTGVDGLLQGGDQSWQDWSAWLPAGRAIWSVGAALPMVPTLDRLMLRTSLASVSLHLPDAVVSCAIAPEGEEDASQAPSSRGFVPGRRTRFIRGNVVALGEAYAVLPPWQAAPMQLLHRQLDNLVGNLPGRDPEPVELDHLNRIAGEETDRLRDFLIAHDLSVGDPPAALAELISQFGRRLRWRQRDGDRHTRSDWVQLLLGQGIRPEVLVTLGGPRDELDDKRKLACRRAALAQAATEAPRHRDFLRALQV